MSLAVKLQLRQTQSLIMTPQLMQSIRLLQLTHFELERFVDEEIERNPLLERADTSEDAEAHVEGDLPESAAGDSDWFAEDNSALDARAIAADFDSSLENIFPDEPGTSSQPVGPDLTSHWKSAGGSTSSGSLSDSFELEDVTAAVRTLRDHVGEQISLAFADPVARMIATELAEGLDEAGYLQAETAEIAGRLGAAEKDVLDALAVCQTFDPPGIFARGLAECLALQLKLRDRFDPAMRALIAHLELLARRDFAALRRICGVDDEDLVDMMAEIRSLDPRPGMAFATGTTDSIVPDVVVRGANDGSWQVELNTDALPRVLVDQAYFAAVSGRTRNSAEKEFFADCLQSANWLTRSLDQRAKTILKVASEIVRQQDAFLIHGVRHLRPLNLRTVADAIGMHESTVSRVTANKYMLTPRGVFELRYFFTAAIAAAGGGDAHSSEAVRDRIRQLIDEEPAVDVLSDDAIVDMLRKIGVDIARRTVAKYREGMNIPSSVQRRREKRAFAAAGR
jgi:RNA polymerase sigma-54 factor